VGPEDEPLRHVEVEAHQPQPARPAHASHVVESRQVSTGGVQVPPEQVSPVAHARPHEPQFKALVRMSTQRPLQSWRPVPVQAQVPPEQEKPAGQP